MKELTIGEVARLTGLQTSAIRYYESIGVLPAAKRVNGQRRYDPQVLKRLGLIQLVRDAGFGIRDLQDLFGVFEAETAASTLWQSLAAAKVAEMDALIQRTQAARAWLVRALECSAEDVDTCIQLTFDEDGESMRVSLSCLLPANTALQLVTMPPT